MQYFLRVGPFRYALDLTVRCAAESIERLYTDYPRHSAEDWSDFHVRLHPDGLFSSNATLYLDHTNPFGSFPKDQAGAMLEWGMNWCVWLNLSHWLIFHAAMLERNGGGLILAADSGVGKSTLAAGLAFSGWRLLSDELTLIDPDDRIELGMEGAGKQNAGVFRASNRNVETSENGALGASNQSVETLGAGQGTAGTPEAGTSETGKQSTGSVGSASVARMVPIPRPICLKNASIEVLKRFAPQAEWGLVYPETGRKGTVSHIKPLKEAVQRMDERVCPRWIVFPRYVPGKKATWSRWLKAETVIQLGKNSVDYSTLGPKGFETMCRLVDHCDCLRFEYSDLHEAAEQFARLAEEDEIPVV